MIKNERLRELEAGVFDFFREQIGIDNRQRGLWSPACRSLLKYLLLAYEWGVRDGIEAAGVKKRQADKLYQDRCQLPAGYDYIPVAGAPQDAQEASTT